MNEYASLDTVLSVPNENTRTLDAHQKSDDAYASLMAKEDKILDLIRLVDDTKREDALRKSDSVSPMVLASVEGFASFFTGLIHYGISGADKEFLALATSSDGMIYIGVSLMALSVLFVFVT
jgi:hypothetical protein